MPQFRLPIVRLVLLGLYCLAAAWPEPLSAAPPAGVSSVAPEFRRLVERLAGDGFDRAEIQTIYARPEVRFDSLAMGDKLMTFYKGKYGWEITRDVQRRLKELGFYPGEPTGKDSHETKEALKAFERAAGFEVAGKPTAALLAAARASQVKAPAGFALPPKPAGPTVFTSVLAPDRIAEAKAFYLDNLKILKRLRETYGVPEDLAVGLLAVETRVGKFLGDQSALISLSSMAASDALERTAEHFKTENLDAGKRAYLESKAQDKAAWAYTELKALLKYARALNQDPLTIVGSIYGAIGVCQFMPSNALKFGVDGDGDGKVDLFNTQDAVMSLGAYMVAHGWKGRADNEADKRKALYAYNHSVVYVNTILAVAERIKQ